MHYGQYSGLLEDPRPLELCKKSNVNDDEASLDGHKNKNKNKVENKDKDENIGPSKSIIDAKLKGDKGTYVNADWGKNKDKDKDKDKIENAGSSKSDIDAKSKQDKRTKVNTDWDKKSDLGKIFSIKLSKA